MLQRAYFYSLNTFILFRKSQLQEGEFWRCFNAANCSGRYDMTSLLRRNGNDVMLRNKKGRKLHALFYQAMWLSRFLFQLPPLHAAGFFIVAIAIGVYLDQNIIRGDTSAAFFNR